MIEKKVILNIWGEWHRTWTEKERVQLQHNVSCDMCSFQALTFHSPYTSCLMRQLAQSLEPESGPGAARKCFLLFSVQWQLGLGRSVCQWVVCLAVVLCIQVEIRGCPGIITYFWLLYQACIVGKSTVYRTCFARIECPHLSVDSKFLHARHD